MPSAGWPTYEDQVAQISRSTAVAQTVVGVCKASEKSVLQLVPGAARSSQGKKTSVKAEFRQRKQTELLGIQNVPLVVTVRL